VEESSSLSMTSLSNPDRSRREVAEATEVFKRNDLDRSSRAALLEGWLRLQSESAGNDGAGSYLQVLHQFGSRESGAD
jgi:hypothetical protein